MSMRCETHRVRYTTAIAPLPNAKRLIASPVEERNACSSEIGGHESGCFRMIAWQVGEGRHALLRESLAGALLARKNTRLVHLSAVNTAPVTTELSAYASTRRR